jgi:hypothetical protein
MTQTASLMDQQSLNTQHHNKVHFLDAGQLELQRLVSSGEVEMPHEKKLCDADQGADEYRNRTQSDLVCQGFVRKKKHLPSYYTPQVLD